MFLFYVARYDTVIFYFSFPKRCKNCLDCPLWRSFFLERTSVPWSREGEVTAPAPKFEDVQWFVTDVGGVLNLALNITWSQSGK